jgi:hypothetical protein
MFNIAWWFVLTSIGCKCYFQGVQHDEGVINLIIVDLSKSSFVPSLSTPSHEIPH